MSIFRQPEDKFASMTQTPIPTLVSTLAVPTIISMLITSLYNMADTFFVGQIGTSATAAVGVALEDCPPVLEYTSVSKQMMLTFSPEAIT